MAKCCVDDNKRPKDINVQRVRICKHVGDSRGSIAVDFSGKMEEDPMEEDPEVITYKALAQRAGCKR